MKPISDGSVCGGEARLRRLLARLNVGVYRATLDGQLIEANPACLRLLGRERPTEGEPLRLLDCFADPDSQLLRWKRLQITGGTPAYEAALRHTDSTLLWVSLNETIEVDASGRAVVEGIMEDISERRQTREVVRTLEKAFDMAQVGVTIADVAGRILYTNPAEARMHGYTVEELLGQSVRVFAPADLWQPIGERIHDATQWGRLSVNVRREGDVFPVQIASDVVRDENGNPIAVVSCCEDLTNHVTPRVTAGPPIQSSYDPITDLPNRALFLERLGQTMRGNHAQSGPPLAVLLVDIDRFRIVNDSIGHAGGDQLLAAVARRLRATLRPGEIAARVGTDEFAVMLGSVAGPAEALAAAERIQATIQTPIQVDGEEFVTTVSVGIAIRAARHEQPEHLMRDADIALHRAKVHGRAGCKVYSDGMHAESVALLQVETGLRRGVELEQFRVYYQPVVSLDTGLLVGFEALVRWQHPEHGLVAPGEFVPVAEDTGLIVPIDRWVLREACRQLVEWEQAHPEHPPLSINVNMSGRQFAAPDLVMAIDDILRETGVNPRRLRLELTESALISHPHAAALILAELKDRGIEILLDDFGTGYSSLSHLHRFPIDAIKIDRSFIHGSTPGSERREITQALVILARQLGMQVIVEGVEELEQLRWLRSLGCALGQGYLFSPPLTPENATVLVDAGAWLQRNSVVLAAAS